MAWDYDPPIYAFYITGITEVLHMSSLFIEMGSH
jgi:hypothetical protein